MDGFIFFIFLIFFVLPFLKRITKSANKSTPKYNRPTKTKNPWGLDHGQIKTKLHKQLHLGDSSDVFPEDHDDRVRARDARDRKELRRMETNIHSRQNRAMTKVANKSRTDWGSRGENGMTSSKTVTIFLLLVLLAHFIILAVAPGIVPGS